MAGRILLKLQFHFPSVEPPYLHKNKVILNFEGSGPQVRKVDGVLREELPDLLRGDGGVNDDILTLLPVDWGGDAVLVTELKSYASVGEHDPWVR